jgi:hypothetical protein
MEIEVGDEAVREGGEAEAEWEVDFLVDEAEVEEGELEIKFLVGKNRKANRFPKFVFCNHLINHALRKANHQYFLYFI